MLAATKNNTITGLQQQLVQIKQMELEYWTNTFSTLTRQASLLTGFSFGGMASIAEFKGQATTLNMLYLSATASSMGFGLCCITTASLCLMMGPGKALRAQDIEQIDETINHLKQKSVLSFWFFVFELLCFHASSFMLMWICYSPLVAFIVNICLLMFLMQFCSEGYDIFDRLYVADAQAVSHDMALLNKERKIMVGRLDSGSNDPSSGTLLTRPLTKEEKQEATMRNMGDDEYLQFQEFKLMKELERKRLAMESGRRESMQQNMPRRSVSRGSVRKTSGQDLRGKALPPKRGGSRQKLNTSGGQNTSFEGGSEIHSSQVKGNALKQWAFKLI